MFFQILLSSAVAAASVDRILRREGIVGACRISSRMPPTTCYSVFFKFSEGIRERGESNNERVFSSRRKIVRRFFLLLETRRLSPPSNDRLT